MASVLLTYDISQRHSEVKAALKKKGYFDYWTSDNQTYNLPNTTMWKKDISAPTAKSDMPAVINELNLNQNQDRKIVLERCIAVEFSIWAGITGQAHKS